MEKRIGKALAARKCRKIKDGNLVPSAVLLPLFQNEGKRYILFIERSDKVEYHKGEISFPGGTVEPDDSDLLYTALRECSEEIGLDPSDVTILGQLDDTPTLTTRFVITPFVGIIPHPYEFRVNIDEISQLIPIPFDALVKEHCSETSRGNSMEQDSAQHIFSYENNVIWGATARILEQLIDLVCR
ncbi:MAG: CoA pyrophosphatase [Deltaproteobacteria bacterium]|nr:CoA pyrophosphatase [Deltaproteobacteria bacterium]MBW2317398.1 CoA pyrophosphatase [Deltaproteobacteria bacterium]OEU45643.1 MAG: hypothetical protein BBJ60_12200 [Desulfobacterales bacterium S7086C20]